MSNYTFSNKDLIKSAFMSLNNEIGLIKTKQLLWHNSI